jgi:hypothetical protein
MRKISQIIHMPDERSVEVEGETRGDRLRLRARLVDCGIVVESLMRDYDAVDRDAPAKFQREFEAITSLAIAGPLFPHDLTSLRCPAAPPHWRDAVVFGIVVGTPGRPQVQYIPPEPLTPSLIETAAPCTPREVFRIAAVCVKDRCPHWQEDSLGAENDGRCSLVERVVEGFEPVNLHPCGIRSVCRWFAQEGPPACRVCPGVATDIGELPQDAEAEVNVTFF